MPGPLQFRKLEQSSAAGVSFKAQHLNVTFDPLNPPPAPSPDFITLRRAASQVWSNFEVAMCGLMAVDDKIHSGVLQYIANNQRATSDDVWQERYRLTLQLQAVAIHDARMWCTGVGKAVGYLEMAAHKEPGTLEAQATVKIDIGVMERSLKTSSEIIEGCVVELRRAKDKYRGNTTS